MRITLAWTYRMEPVDPEKLIAPSGLYILAELAHQRGHEAEVCRLEAGDIEAWIAQKKPAPDILGVSVLTCNRFLAASFAQAARQKWPNCLIVAGGPHVSPMAREYQKAYPQFDAIICGEGENSFLRLLEYAENMSCKTRNNRPGRQRVFDPAIAISCPAEPTCLDLLPNPAKRWIYGNILTSRGCPGNCSFCATPQICGNKIRYRHPESIIEEMDCLVNRHGLTSLAISDDMFTADLSRCASIAEQIIKKGLQVKLDIRFRPTIINTDLARLLRRAGVISGGMGLESGDSRVLTALNKHVDHDTIAHTTRNLQQVGIRVNLFVITGAPGENRASFDRTMKLVDRLSPDFVTPAILHIFPGTPLEKKSRAEGLQIDWFNENLPESAPLYTLQANMKELHRRYNRLTSWKRPTNKRNCGYAKSRHGYRANTDTFDCLDMKADRFYDCGNISRAIKTRLLAFKKLPTPEISFKLSRDYLETGDIKSARTYLEQAIRSWTTEKNAGLRQFPEQVLGLGMALCRAGRWHEARRQLRYSCIFNQNNWENYAWLSMATERCGEDPAPLLSVACDLFPGNQREFAEALDDLLT